MFFKDHYFFFIFKSLMLLQPNDYLRTLSSRSHWTDLPIPKEPKVAVTTSFWNRCSAQAIDDCGVPMAERKPATQRQGIESTSRDGKRNYRSRRGERDGTRDEPEVERIVVFVIVAVIVAATIVVVVVVVVVVGTTLPSSSRTVAGATSYWGGRPSAVSRGPTTTEGGHSV